MTKKLFYLLMLLCVLGFQSAQAGVLQLSSDSLAVDSSQMEIPKAYRLDYRHMIAPTVFITYGLLGLSMESLRKLNTSTQYEISEHRPDRIKLDNYSQYMPALMVYGLNAAGVKGQHNLKDRTIIYLGSQLISGALVTGLKHVVKEERPDGSNMLSFPSGHTATAFSSAQFMFREYKDQNFWLSISGYPFALFTGVYRTLNNRHWVGDVVAGAGFGILSTELAYFLYPRMENLFQHKKRENAILITPFYQDHAIGIGLLKNF